MPGSFGDYAENKVLELIVGKTAWTTPTAYVALYTVAPTDAGGGTEVTGGNYSRVATAGSDWNAAASGSISNANGIVFPGASAGWGLIVAFALWDAATAGNLLGWGTLAASRTITAGQTASFAPGDLDITLD